MENTGSYFAAYGETSIAHWNHFAGANNEFIPIHMDDAAARALGFRGAFAMGNLQWSWVHRALRDWFGDQDRISQVRLRFIAPAYEGDVTVFGTAEGPARLAIEVRVGGDRVAEGSVELK